MYGKLLGLGAIGFTIILVWVGFALTAALSVQGVVADFIRPSLAALDQPWIVAAMLFYFVAGYLIISMLYLAIGALSNSLQDAQAYLMPVIFIIMLPTMFMMITIVQNPDALLPRVMSWIPLYTPFAMLGRMGSGVSLLEVLGTGVMLAAFVVAELFLIGRLFQASLLQTGQPPALMGLIRRMSGKAKAA
jgi:ABC-2 type transport system permease protein